LTEHRPRHLPRLRGGGGARRRQRHASRRGGEDGEGDERSVG